MKIVGIIPARYGSTRFPGKPLAELRGKPMILHTLESALSSTALEHVVVATDHPGIYETVTAAGHRAVMTREDHPSGTDRCLEALHQLDASVEAVINIQGDEPFVASEAIAKLAALLRAGAPVATLCTPLPRAEAANPNRVKVVKDLHGRALYFSRSIVPFDRGGVAPENCFLHLGMYGYSRSGLETIAALVPSDLERTESLEQLRWLEHGVEIRIAETAHTAHGVDTPEDLEALNRQPGS